MFLAGRPENVVDKGSSAGKARMGPRTLMYSKRAGFEYSVYHILPPALLVRAQCKNLYSVGLRHRTSLRNSPGAIRKASRVKVTLRLRSTLFARPSRSCAS
jgi:hypothetical protein